MGVQVGVGPQRLGSLRVALEGGLEQAFGLGDLGLNLGGDPARGDLPFELGRDLRVVLHGLVGR